MKSYVSIQCKIFSYSNSLSGRIARALVNDPDILLADEPTGNLDTKRSVEIMEILKRLNVESQITILMVTHEPDMAQYATRKIIFLDGLIQSDSLNEDFPHIAQRDSAFDSTMRTQGIAK